MLVRYWRSPRAPGPIGRSSFMNDVREQDVAHHALSQSMPMELSGDCGVMFALVGDSNDSTFSATYVRGRLFHRCLHWRVSRA